MLVVSFERKQLASYSYTRSDTDAVVSQGSSNTFKSTFAEAITFYKHFQDHICWGNNILVSVHILLLAISVNEINVLLTVPWMIQKVIGTE